MENTTSTTSVAIDFNNSYSQLPEQFFVRQQPTPVTRPELIKVNEDLARQLGIDPDSLSSPQGIEILAGNRTPDGADPLAMAYAGHQFGGWSPQLGDGRAILLGEVIDNTGVRQDIQLKGSGKTPFSRGGDGRAWLGPVLREYIVSEAMAALGVPTTRALAAVLTGDTVLREDGPLPGAVLTRVARSHIRVGTFQYFAARRDTDALRALSEHVIARHYPSAITSDNPTLALLDAVIEKQIALIAQWQSIGFIHGVMNTDNTAISGDTIDYGPCAFMDTYHPETVYSAIDQMKRYAFQNQPGIAQWNLANFAQCLLPLLDDDEEKAVSLAQERIDSYADRYASAYVERLRAKLGLVKKENDDLQLGTDLLDLMAANKADFTLTFRALSSMLEQRDSSTTNFDEMARDLFDEPTAFDNWAQRWRQRLNVETLGDEERHVLMKLHNPAFIPRNHRIQEVITAAVDEQNYDPFNTLLEVLSSPYEEQPEHIAYVDPPRPSQVVRQTFCGT